MCGSNGRRQSAGLGVNTSFSQQSQVALKLPFGGIFPFSPCLPTPTGYRPSGFAVVELGCKTLEGNSGPFSRRCLLRAQARGGEVGSSQSPRYWGLPGAVPLDGNVVLSELGLPVPVKFLLFLYLSLPNWWLHPPPRQENRTKSFHRTLQLLCLFLFFLFAFFPPPLVLCPTAGCRGLKTFFLNRSPSKNRENTASWEQLAVRKAFLKQLPGNIVLTDIPDVTLSFSVLLF